MAGYGNVPGNVQGGNIPGTVNQGQGAHNQGYGDDIGHGYHKSALKKEEVQNLANRTDISPEEKERRRHKLEKEIAAGVVGAGILGFAGYELHSHHENKKLAADQQLGGVPPVGEQKHHHHHHGL